MERSVKTNFSHPPTSLFNVGVRSLSARAAWLVRFQIARAFRIWTLGRTNVVNWPDAEAFLSYVDTAASPSVDSKKERIGRARLRTIVTDLSQRGLMGTPNSPTTLTPEVMKGAALRLIAAQCCAFLRDCDFDLEEWGPYISWANDLLRNGDTVITFNYDCILEKLNLYRRSLHANLGGYMNILDTDGLSVALWGKRIPQNPDDEPGLPCVLKLHGSTGWSRTERKLPDNKITWDYRYQKDGDEYALTCAPNAIAISAPGPGKLTASKQLESLWKKALEAISDAHVIVFIGYRFPKTDADARSKLLGAIAARDRNGPRVQVHTVLGPSENDDTVRLAQMLAFSGVRNPTGRSAEILKQELWVHRLWSQDFMSLATRYTVEG